MSQHISLEQARRKAIRLLNYEDGLWDILLGSIFVLLSIYPVTRNLLGPALNLLLFLAIMAILIAGFSYARRVISVPRIGIAKMHSTREQIVTRVILIALVLITVTAVVATLLSVPNASEPRTGVGRGWIDVLGVDIAVAVVTIGFFSLMAYLFGITRMYLYGWLIGVGNLASTALDLYMGYQFHFPLAIGGVIIVLLGAIRITRFLRQYAIPTEEP
ncbi:MAG: hypothetical protein M1546_10805 [Chloroflexi bacterium]|nr:hypothetical protein [Chloroflexota bacterium]